MTIRAARLEVPVRAAWDGEPEPAPFAPPEEGPRPRIDTLEFTPGDHELSTGIAAGEHRLVHRYPAFRQLHAQTGIEMAWEEPDTFTIRDGDPLSARVDCERRVEVGRGDWRIRLEARASMAADEADFHVTTELRAYENGAAVHARAWSFRVRRD